MQPQGFHASGFLMCGCDSFIRELLHSEVVPKPCTKVSTELNVEQQEIGAPNCWLFF